MTVDQIPLPFTAIRPLPPPSWPAADSDPFGAEAPPATPPREDEPPGSPGGWPRIFPGL